MMRMVESPPAESSITPQRLFERQRAGEAIELIDRPDRRPSIAASMTTCSVPLDTPDPRDVIAHEARAAGDPSM
ncbi:MAG: hypothetical protein U0790_05310 [Isosphaeraceae bacterium]